MKLRYPGGWSPRTVYVVAFLTLIYAFNYADRQILALVLPLLKNDLVLSDTQLGFISGAMFVLFYSILGIPIARLADRSNRRNILAVGFGFWSLMTALTGAVTSVWQLAATRFLMGAGEASGLAPTHSMVSDIFDKKRRPFALAIVAGGTSLSALIFFPLVGWISQDRGWRAAFYVAGISGFVLSVLFFMTVSEPQRAGSVPDKRQEKFGETIRFILGARSFVLMVLGGSFMGISLYAGQIWHPSFLVRVHHLSLAEVGASLGVLRGVLGLIGAMFGGFLADRLGRRDERWRLWVPGLACMMVLPAELVFLLVVNVPIALAGLGMTSFFAAMHFGPLYAAVQGIARPSMRATAAAIFLLFANLIGQITGPLVVGYLNDQMAAVYGDLAIRYSLIFGGLCAFAGGIGLVVAAARLSRDTARAET
jgi:MFS family permease